MTFRVGQKVVCIHQPKSAIAKQWMELGANYPSKNSIYTIRDIVSFPDGSSGFLLQELWNDHLGYKPEPAFDACHFRPIVERKTDISVFTKMLTDTKVPALTN